MNRRVTPLALQEVAANLAPFRPHVDTSPRGESSSLVPPRGENLQPAEQRRVALDRLHTYIWAACGYDHNRARTIYNRVVTTLDGQLGGDAERSRSLR